MRARKDAHDQVDLLLVEQPRRLVDRDLGLRLRVGVDRDDLVALDAAALVQHVDRDLRAEPGGFRSASGERAGVVVDHAHLEFLLLCVGGVAKIDRRCKD
jgi:hypothetical protein